MRIDLISVFPAYFDVLKLSLLGKAQQDGLIEIHAHDLRDFTNDRHRTVDDSPYGGGPGMLMKPEPWGVALDHVAPAASGPQESPLLVVPTPAGRPFSHSQAQDWSRASHVVFACARYEGLDQRVVDSARSRFRVHEVSIGDYVVNGGEVAALVMVEAMVRLIPGVIGNQGSLHEESHVAGLLEAPSYTKPASWRSLDVPTMLTSGDHAAIDRWRREASLRRTSQMRPDLIRHQNPRTLTRADLAVLASCGWVVIDGQFSLDQPTVAD